MLDDGATTGETVGAVEVVGAVVGRGGAVVGVGVAVAGVSGFGGVKTGAADGFVVGASGFGGVKTGAAVGGDGFAEFAGGGKGWGEGKGFGSACGAEGDVCAKIGDVKPIARAIAVPVKKDKGDKRAIRNAMPELDARHPSPQFSTKDLPERRYQPLKARLLSRLRDRGQDGRLRYLHRHYPAMCPRRRSCPVYPSW